MKIDVAMRFPYPVLWERTNDYKAGAFRVEMEITESSGTGRLSLRYQVTIDEDKLRSLVEQGQASVGLFVTCKETYFNELLPIAFNEGTTEIAGGRLRGSVILRPMVWSEEDANVSNDNIHEEFGSTTWAFKRASLLALGNEEAIYVGSEKLAPIGSIFMLSRKDDLPEGETRIFLEDEKIRILAEEKTYLKIHQLRGNRIGKAVLLNSVYLPAVMGVLASLREDPSAFEGHRWHRIFTAKMVDLGINPKTGNILEDAQKVLKAPFLRIQNQGEWRLL